MNGEGAARPSKRKLIEVALPLEVINKESAREKEPFTRNHPRGIHIWWSRKPLVAARAVLFAQLVDDPSSHPDRFPTEESQQTERRRLHRLIERLVVWENTRDEGLIDEARQEILSSTGGNPPPILDPFAGGGTIPLEAQRLGLEARASDLNPVAVLINKALIEIPPKFAGKPPVFPGLAEERTSWEGATGLAADVRAYGEWMSNEAEKRIGQHYPKATLNDGTDANVIAWIWARTVTCPNPKCGIDMPLVSKWWLSKKKGKEAWVRPSVVADETHPSGKRVEYQIENQAAGPAIQGTMSGRSGAVCIACAASVSKDYVKSEGVAARMSASLMAVVAEGDRRRVYLSPSESHRRSATLARPANAPDQEIGNDPRALWTPLYGLTRFSDLFTNRQLLALTTLCDLVAGARGAVFNAASSAVPASADRRESFDDYAAKRADAVALYLGLSVSRYADMSNTICSWNQTNENIRALFARQGIPMSWDFAEANPIGRIGFDGPIVSTANSLSSTTSSAGYAEQAAAQQAVQQVGLISTDPPYYDNIGYSDLSDFFYVWLRKSLRGTFPGLLDTVLVPKQEELVANPYRHEGKDGARRFFEKGFSEVFAKARDGAMPDYPVTVYYAFKQSDVSKEGNVSTGWETLLTGMIDSGWTITATWPVRSERRTRSVSIGTNALASSIVLALRPRPDDAPTTDRRGFIAALQGELPAALRNLQQGAIAPVDLPQAAIGPGMAVFSRYSKVIENDGKPMSVRSALARINEILDEVLNEQEGDFDEATRFAIAWYRQHGYDGGQFGDADNMARARNTSVEAMDRDGILESIAGKVTLLAPDGMPNDYDPLSDDRISAWELLHNLIAALDRDGLAEAGRLLAAARERPDAAIDSELVKELAFLLFSLAEKNGWTKDALAFNTIATAWPEIVAEADSPAEPTTAQDELDFEGES